MNTMLHLINKSPTDRNSLDSCLRLAEAGSSVLLLEDGVYAALSKASSAEAVNQRMEEHTGSSAPAQIPAQHANVDQEVMVDMSGDSMD